MSAAPTTAISHTFSANNSKEEIDPLQVYYSLLGVKVYIALWKWVSPFLLVLGGFGNTLSVLVLTRKSLRHTATAVFLINLAVVDTVLLYRSLMRGWLINMWEIDYLSKSVLGCKFLMAMAYFARYMSPWSLVLVSIERFVAVYLPLKHKTWFSRKRAILYMIALNVIFLCMTSFFYEIQHLSDEGKCTRKEKYENFWNIVWQRIHLMLASVLPFVIMISITIAIMIKMRKNKRATAGKSVSLNKMLIMVNIVFLICTLPAGISFAINGTLIERAKTLKDTANIYLLRAVTNLLTYLNSAINFVLYVLFGKRFRDELLRMFRRDNKVMDKPEEGTIISNIKEDS